MKVGEIKAEALRLMFVNYNQSLPVETLSEYENDETFGSYLINMDGSIQRALDRISNAGKLGIAVLDLPEQRTQSAQLLRYDLSQLAPDLQRIDKVVYDDGYDRHFAQYDREGDTLLIRKIYRGRYVLYYHPMPPDVSKLTYTTELNIPDRVARLIPYFIKSELYAEEEPQEAAAARNLFEQSLEDLEELEDSFNDSVSVVYGME